ncbi:MAG: transglycosylase SLT domain-containing protein [Candidatus Moranbacteria bacterium]|nr:transglycosylase SLT domain-containing protein [Candidatus Moranbacteria bacterium]
MNQKKFLSIAIFILLLFPTITLAALNLSYVPMEQIPGVDTGSNFYTYIAGVYKFGIWAVGISALLMITIGGYMYIMSAANVVSAEKAKGVITDAIVGLILALVSFLLLYEINPNLVRLNRGNIISSSAPTTTVPAPVPVGQKSPPCTNAASNLADICTGSCEKTCTNLGQYEALINKYQTASVPAKLIRSIICHESTGDPSSVSPVGACGLMQVMPSGSCSSDTRFGNLFDPETNIKAGVATFEAKLNSIKQFNYPSVTAVEMAAASYNCCADNSNPNSLSVDCKADNIPKWACPINPGPDPKTNMCTVKDYACDIALCAI